jgi:hypothetical protein
MKALGQKLDHQHFVRVNRSVIDIDDIARRLREHLASLPERVSLCDHLSKGIGQGTMKHEYLDFYNRSLAAAQCRLGVNMLASQIRIAPDVAWIPSEAGDDPGAVRGASRNEWLIHCMCGVVVGNAVGTAFTPPDRNRPRE